METQLLSADAWLINSIIVICALLVLAFLLLPRFRRSRAWHATVTPLASIIGSGFLVCAPLLALAVGQWAAAVMLIIVVLAYALGSSIRFNICYVEPNILADTASSPIMTLEYLSSLALGIAYIISVAFYLKLLSVFVLRGLGFHSIMLEDSLTTVIMLGIGISGKVRGLSLLELQELYSVSFKLAIIVALILGLFIYNGLYLRDLHFLTVSSPHLQSPWVAFREILGMLLIVQGFETSRYLSDEYQSQVRVRTMRYAQVISGIIYFVFIVLCTMLLKNIHHVSETLIIQLSRNIALVLPVLITVAAVMSQFSAAIADTIGSGGLLAESTKHFLSPKNAYLIVTFLVIVLVWLTNVYHIIVIASKAFAIYYGLQLITSLISIKPRHVTAVLQYGLYVILLVVMLLVVVLGIPVE